MTRPNTPEDLWRRVEKTDGCWNWTGARTAPGWHGVMKLGADKVLVHRLSWEIAHGPIPPGLRVLHWCDNAGCVRPDHLWLGTQRQNMQDASRKGRTGPQQRKNETHCKRGHAFQGNTYIHPVTGRRGCHECIRLRNKARPARPPVGSHWAKPDDSGTCLECGEQLEHGNIGGGRIGWRHSRWAA